MKIGKFSIDIITQQLVTSKNLIKNKFKGHVIFEKYNPIKKWNGFVTVSSGDYSFASGIDTAIMCEVSNVTIIGRRHDNVGGYDISGNKNVIFLLSKKPNYFQKNIVNILLGWKYIEPDKI